MRARQIMPQRAPDDPRGSFIQRKASRHAADAIGAKQRALPGFHFCGDRQDAINGGGFLILPRIAPKAEASCGTAALGCVFYGWHVSGHGFSRAATRPIRVSSRAERDSP